MLYTYALYVEVCILLRSRYVETYRAAYFIRLSVVRILRQGLRLVGLGGGFLLGLREVVGEARLGCSKVGGVEAQGCVQARV